MGLAGHIETSVNDGYARESFQEVCAAAPIVTAFHPAHEPLRGAPRPIGDDTGCTEGGLYGQ
jgi:hypothetical protein